MDLTDEQLDAKALAKQLGMFVALPEFGGKGHVFWVPNSRHWIYLGPEFKETETAHEGAGVKELILGSC